MVNSSAGLVEGSNVNSWKCEGRGMLCRDAGLRKAAGGQLLTLHLTLNSRPPHCKLNRLFPALPVKRINDGHLNSFTPGNFCCGSYPQAPSFTHCFVSFSSCQVFITVS